MADLPISNRYKAYKEGTDSLVRWITQTASRYSNTADFLRTLARPDRGAVTPTTCDLVTLTKLVVANDALEIPEDILKITQDVAAEREVCANWYTGQNMKGELTATDKTHAYFIGILHEIYDILDSARGASRKQDCPQPPQQTPSESIPGAFNNSFQHLKVEEPVENPLGTTTVTIEGFTAADKLTFRLEKQKGDKAFAIWCLLEDFRAVRNYITSVWQDHRAGRRSLLAAGAITDTAFGLMRHANEDFAIGHGDVASYQDMIKFLEEEELIPRKSEALNCVSMDGEFLEGETTKGDHTMGRRGFCAFQDQNMFLCREAGQRFDNLTKAFRGSTTDAASNAPLLQPSSYAPGNDSPLGVFGGTLLKLVPSILQMACKDKFTHHAKGEQNHRISVDEFLSALMKLAISAKYPQAPIWLVAAGQSYTDIHTILGGEMSCGTEYYQSYLHRIRPLAKRGKTLTSDNPDDPPYKFYEKVDDEAFCRHWEITQELAQVAKAQDWNFTFPKSTAVLAHFLPLYPCCLSYRLRYYMQYHSMKCLSFGLVVIPMAHLYKAGQKYGLIKSTWKDMDLILANHVTHKRNRRGTQPIVSKPSKSADAFRMAALFRAALGVPTVDLNKAVRPRLPELPNTAWRCITHQSIFGKRWERLNVESTT
jgi:hypothetical protein